MTSVGIFSTSGSKIFIGGPLAAKTTDFVLADFNAQSWVEIGWTENLGQLGDESAGITFDAISKGRTQKLKGNRNAGTQQLVCGVDSGDEGQQNLVLAEATPYSYAMKIELDDAPPGGTPSYRYYIAKVQSAREQLDTANNVVKFMATLDIDSNVVRIAATG